MVENGKKLPSPPPFPPKNASFPPKTPQTLQTIQRCTIFYFGNLDLGNFSIFRNYPNYFRFPIYKFISQKIFSTFISHDQHDERYKNKPTIR